MYFVGCFLTICGGFLEQTGTLEQVFSVALNNIYSRQVMKAHASLSALSGQLMR